MRTNEHRVINHDLEKSHTASVCMIDDNIFVVGCYDPNKIVVWDFSKKEEMISIQIEQRIHSI